MGYLPYDTQYYRNLDIDLDVGETWESSHSVSRTNMDWNDTESKMSTRNWDPSNREFELEDLIMSFA